MTEITTEPNRLVGVFRPTSIAFDHRTNVDDRPVWSFRVTALANRVHFPPPQSMLHFASHDDVRAITFTVPPFAGSDQLFDRSVQKIHPNVLTPPETESSRRTNPQVRYLNAHGPGTAQCDAAETVMLESVLDSNAQVYSIKPLTGHCQGAASAIETAAAIVGFDRGIVPAAPRVADGHSLLLDGFTDAEPGLTVKSSLGMGGHNSVVVLAPA